MNTSLRAGTARLVVIPLWDEATAPRLVGTIRMLDREHIIDVAAAVFVTWCDEGGLRAAPALDGNKRDLGARCGTWRAVLAALVGSPAEVYAEADTVSDDVALDVGADSLSTSFVREVRETVLPGTSFLVLVVGADQTDTIVHEVERLPGVRMIYGAVPDSWFAN